MNTKTSAAALTLALTLAAVAGCAKDSEPAMAGSYAPAAATPTATAVHPTRDLGFALDHILFQQVSGTIRKLHFALLIPGPGRVGVGVR